MIEPIGPEAYLAIASAARNTVTRYRDNRHAKKSAKLAHAISQNSGNETSLSSSSLDDSLAQEGLQLDEDGYVQFCSNSPAHPRAWSKARKVYDLLLIMFLNFYMRVMSNAVSHALETILALPMALLWSAWTIPPNTTGTPWVASGLSLILLGYAIGEIILSLPQALGVSSRAAADEKSVLTATAFLQAIFAGGGVLVTEVMYTNLNNNIATSVLAAIATVTGLLILVLVYGSHTREVRGVAVEEAGQRGLLEKKQKKRERAGNGERRYTSVTAAGAMGLDLERLAVFPYFF